MVSLEGVPSGIAGVESVVADSPLAVVAASAVASSLFFLASAFFCSFTFLISSLLALKASTLSFFSSSVGGGTAFLMKMFLLWNF